MNNILLGLLTKAGGTLSTIATRAAQGNVLKGILTRMKAGLPVSPTQTRIVARANSARKVGGSSGVQKFLGGERVAAPVAAAPAAAPVVRTAAPSATAQAVAARAATPAATSQAGYAGRRAGLGEASYGILV